MRDLRHQRAATGAALVPVFSGYFANDEPEEAWRLSSTVINVLLIVLSLCALVGWLAAPFIVRVVATADWSAQMEPS